MGHVRRIGAAAVTVTTLLALMTPPASAATYKRWKSVTEGYCLRIAGSSSSPNAYAVMGSCGSGADVWSNGGTITNTWIKNYNSDLCLTIAGGSTISGAAANQYYCDTHLSRYWDIISLGSQRWKMKNRNSGFCLAATGGSGTRAVQLACSNNATVWQELPL